MGRTVRLILLLFGFAFFCYLVNDLGIANILANLKKTGWWFLPVIGIWGVGYIFNALAYQQILGDEGKQIGFWELLRITLSSFAINYSTPLVNLGGEPFRAMAVQDRIGMRRAVSSVFLFRMVHAIGQFVFWLITIVTVAIWFPLSPSIRLYLLLIFIVVTAAIGVLIIAHKRGVLSLLLKVISWIPFSKGLTARVMKHEEAIREIDSQITELYNVRRKAFYLSVFHELMSRYVVSLEFYFILHAIGSKVTLVDSFYINAASTLLLNLVFFIPYEMGAREGSLYLIMESLGLSAGVGVYTSLVNRIREAFWIAVGFGLVYFTGRKIPHTSLDPSRMEEQIERK
jgi:hypothetical protein